MHEPDMRNQKIIASAAATIIALACGTNVRNSLILSSYISY